MLIEAKNIRKDYGGTPVLAGASLAVATGEKVGLVGRNGAGKTTLLRILTGADDDYAGSVVVESGKTVAYVPQYFPDFPGTAADYVAADPVALRARLRAAEEALGEAEGRDLDRLLAEYGRLREEYDRVDGDGAEERSRRFLSSIGLERAADTPTSALSGGERNVLALGRALLAKSDLLILDEPGNHLDAWGLSWLESFLAGIPQAVLVVSHNRYLLDRTVGRIVELEAGRTASYAGGWSAYRMEKLRKSAAQGLDWQADRKKLERLEELVKRFEQIARSRPDPAWGRRLRARRTQLERAREEAVEKPAGEGPRISADFAVDPSRADIAASVEAYTRSVPAPDEPNGERVLFRDADLLIRTGERVGLIGPNGSGKTTFLTDLVTRGSWDDRTLRIGPSLTVGWCAQHQETFDPSRTIREEFLRLGAFTEDAVAAALGKFLFSRADLDARIGDLSGGERNRLQLARAALLGADFLILDEPTNHLDVGAREAIEEALADFKGTLLVVSHDRWFLDRLVDRIVEIDDCGFTSWEGNFSEFWYRSGAASRRGAFGAKASASGGVEARGRARAADGAGKARRGGAEAAESGAALAARIEKLEEERTVLERRSTAALAAGDFRTARTAGAELDKLARIIDRLYAEWAV